MKQNGDSNEKWKSSTTSWNAKEGLPGNDIVAIIKECAKGNVIHFELGDLKIQFGLNKLNDAKDLAEVSMPIPTTSSQRFVDQDPSNPEIPKLINDDDDDDFSEHISDPVEWQKNQLSSGKAEE